MHVGRIIKRIPILGDVARRIYRGIRRSQGADHPFPGSDEYWEERYATGGNSGVGSYGKFAEFKAEVINGFVRSRGVKSVIEFGCGDGSQLRLADYPSYVGIDVSKSAIERCRAEFGADSTKAFQLRGEYGGEKADLALSLDVIYHLVEDEVFEVYMQDLFGAARRFVAIYSSNADENTISEASHVRHRKFTDWVERNAPAFGLVEHIPNRHPYHGDYTTGSFADFYIYERS
jgi:SAM-dependent methyltransferase